MENKFDWKTSTAAIQLESDTMLVVQTLSASVQQQVARTICKSGAKCCVIGAQDKITSLVFTEQVVMFSLPVNVQYAQLSLHPLCEITAFLDQSQQAMADNARKELFLNVDFSVLDELIYWFICCFMMGNAREKYPELLECIRKQESYFLTCYLIENRCSNEKINSLCETYGLSYSYFRKISKKYLGVSAKAKMSEWRLAQTILDILEGDKTITEIALKNGYSSSAHVCSTFKSVLGISPYAIRKINDK